MKVAFEFYSLEDFVAFLRSLGPDPVCLEQGLVTQIARLKAASRSLQAAIDRQPHTGA